MYPDRVRLKIRIDAIKIALAISAASVAVIAGCSRKDSVPGGPRVGASLMQQDQFFRLNEAGMKAAAKKLGADLRVQNAGGALDKEITLTETFMAQKMGAILVSPLSAQASRPALKRAADAGIRIVTYNNSLGA